MELLKAFLVLVFFKYTMIEQQIKHLNLVGLSQSLFLINTPIITVLIQLLAITPFALRNASEDVAEIQARAPQYIFLACKSPLFDLVAAFSFVKNKRTTVHI